MAKARTLTLNTKVNVTGADKLRGLGQQFQKVGAGLSVAVTAPLALLTGAASKAASDLNESMNAINVTFGETQDAINAIGETSAESFGLSQRAFNEVAVRFSAFADIVAGDGGNVASVIETLTQRGSDFASVYNLEVNDALGLFQSGLAGETEPLRKFGIDLSAAAVEAHALKAGISDGNSALTEAQKVQARYSLLMEATSKVQGDFANTSGEVANQQRIAAAAAEDAAAALGQKFLPIQQKIIGLLSDAIAAWSKLPPSMQDAIIIFGAAAAALGPLLLVIGSLVRGLGVLIKVLPISSAAMKRFGLAAKGALGPIGAILLAIEGVNLAGGAIKDWIGGATAAYDRLGQAASKSFPELKAAATDIADETGKTVESVILDLDRLVNAGVSWEHAIQAVGRGMDAVDWERHRANVAAAGESWDAYQNQIRGVSDDLSNVDLSLPDLTLGDEIVEEVKSAGQLAREEAKRIPFEISQGIIEGRDAVVQAAFQLSTAATDALVSDQRIKEAREKMAELAELTAEEIEAATPATEAARKAELAALEIQLAGYLLRADPQSAEAAALLRKHLESEDPATRAAADALMSAVEDRALIMERNVEESARAAGVSIPFALAQAKREALNEARLLTEGVKQRLDRLQYDGAAAGEAFHISLAAAMGASRWRVYSEAVATASAIRGVFPHSEPDDPNSPLRGITKGFNFNQILAKGLRTSLSAVQGAIRGSLGGGIGFGAMQPLAVAAGGGGGGGTTINNIYLQWDGEPPKGRDEAEIASNLQRLFPLFGRNN